MGLLVSSVPSRRRTLRIPATWDVWVYWESDHLRDVSHVRDLSHAGLFIETHRRRPAGDLLHVNFLVQEGQIRLEGVVTHAEAGQGLGLKLTSISNEDIPQLTALLNRIRYTAINPPTVSSPAA